MLWLRCRRWYTRKILCLAFTFFVLLAGTSAGFQSSSPTATPTVVPAQAQAPNAEPSNDSKRRNYTINEIKKYRAKAREAYHTMWGLLHIAILVVCVVLIRHTAAVTKGARFMRCFINSYIVTASFYGGAVLMPYFLAYMANHTPTDDLLIPLEQLESSLVQLREIDYMWDAIDSFLSLFSSFYVIMGWHLLKRYPDETIAREFYTVLNMIFAAIVAPLLVGALLLRQPEVQPRSQGLIFVLVDTLTAGAAIILFGWELWKKMRPSQSQPTKSRLQRFLQKSWPLLSSPIPIIFVLWGAMQPAYAYFRSSELSHPYFGLLLILKLLAGISVVIAGSTTLKERPAFQSEDPVIGAKTAEGLAT